MFQTTTGRGAMIRGPNQANHQHKLLALCYAHDLQVPTFQIISDMRGKRTAWSCIITINDRQVAARFWYDGEHIDNSREDAAEKALQMFGILAAPPGPKPSYIRRL